MEAEEEKEEEGGGGQGGGGGGGFVYGFGGQSQAHRTSGGCMMASPTTLHIGQPCHIMHSQDPTVAPSAFPRWVAALGHTPCCCRGALESRPPPSLALSLAPANSSALLRRPFLSSRPSPCPCLCPCSHNPTLPGPYPCLHPCLVMLVMPYDALPGSFSDPLMHPPHLLARRLRRVTPRAVVRALRTRGCCPAARCPSTLPLPLPFVLPLPLYLLLPPTLPLPLPLPLHLHPPWPLLLPSPLPG